MIFFCDTLIWRKIIRLFWTEFAELKMHLPTHLPGREGNPSSNDQQGFLLWEFRAKRETLHVWPPASSTCPDERAARRLWSAEWCSFLGIVDMFVLLVLCPLPPTGRRGRMSIFVSEFFEYINEIRRWVAAHMCVLSHFRTCDVRAKVRAERVWNCACVVGACGHILTCDCAITFSAIYWQFRHIF